jgi:hypothetical protein
MLAVSPIISLWQGISQVPKHLFAPFNQDGAHPDLASTLSQTGEKKFDW